jgi:AcrR family transcriptional regulator
MTSASNDSELPHSDATLRWGDRSQRRKQGPELKRLAILRTAAQLFNEHGFYETSLNDLARQLHVTKPSLYYYVQSKDDILLQILHQAMAEVDPAIDAAEQANNGLEMLRVFIDRYARVLVGDFGKCLVLCGTLPLEQTSRDQLAPSYRRIDQAVRRMVANGIADGSINQCDPKIAGFALFGALHWMTSWYRKDGLSPEELGAQIFAIFEKGLRPASARKR